MSAIDPAIVKAAENVVGPTCPDCGHLVGEHSHDVGCMTDGPMVRNQVGFCPCQRSSLRLIVAAVDSAEKRGAARVREAVEAIHRPQPECVEGYQHLYCMGCWSRWPCQTARAVVEGVTP